MSFPLVHCECITSWWHDIVQQFVTAPSNTDRHNVAQTRNSRTQSALYDKMFSCLLHSLFVANQNLDWREFKNDGTETQQGFLNIVHRIVLFIHFYKVAAYVTPVSTHEKHAIIPQSALQIITRACKHQDSSLHNFASESQHPHQCSSTLSLSCF